MKIIDKYLQKSQSFNEYYTELTQNIKNKFLIQNMKNQLLIDILK